MVMEGDLTWSGEHTIQSTGVLQNCTPEAYITLTNVTPINLILKNYYVVAVPLN